MNEDILMVVAVGSLVFCLAGLVLVTAANWKILTKAGEKGWKILIPLYNLIVYHRIIGMSIIWLIIDIILTALGIAALVVGENALWFETTTNILSLTFTLIYEIVFINKLCNVFGKGDGFKLGMFFMPLIFFPVLAFGGPRYFPPGTEHPDKPHIGSPEARIRRQENNLTTLGRGIIALSVWILAKYFLVSFFYKDESDKLFSDTVSMIVFSIITVIFVLMFLMYSVVGLCAISEGSGNRRRFLILAGLAVVLQSSILLLEVLMLPWEGFDLSTVVSVIFDCTVLIFLIELISSAIKLRKLKSRQERSEQKGEAYES